MERIKIHTDYEYLYFDNQIDFFAAVDKFLSEGYEVTDSVHLCVEVTKDKHTYLLSYIPVEHVDEHIKDTLKGLDVPYKVIYPDYEKCILNIIASIQKSLGKTPEYSTNSTIDEILKEKEYKHIILLLLDGLGENILENNLPNDSFLKQHHVYTNIAIYPSTTAASTTATKNGLAPIRTAWLGWENYFQEIHKNICLFNGTDYVTDEPTGFNTYKALPYSLFHEDLKIVEPDFKKENRDFTEVLKNSLRIANKQEKSLQYVYFTEPDSSMHEFGAYSQTTKDKLERIEAELVKYKEALPSDTLLIISADHGHTNVSPIELWACPTIQRMLKRMPSNDSRCITFCVKDEFKPSFMKTFKDLFGYAYDIYPTEEAIRRGFFGKTDDAVHPRTKDFLADFVAVGIKEYYFNYKGKDNIVFKSHHAGMTAEEMLVPVIIYRK